MAGNGYQPGCLAQMEKLLHYLIDIIPDISTFLRAL